ncbi:MAG: phosphonate C-P lyase system protein PhnG [Alphaproteobacteria bacterium]|nr:phosphonate C-P lyase system protein PhnG [Alphaproteobacteria bacterium]
MPGNPVSDSSEANRARWLSVLAKAPIAELDRHWTGIAAKPTYTYLRQPEIGLTMVRGRIGGTGNPFNLGEMTVTRCSILTDDGRTGHGYVAGRDRHHAELTAVLDAMLQDDGRRDELTRSVIAPLAKTLAHRHEARAREAAATRVEFFTMVRGEDE